MLIERTSPWPRRMILVIPVVFLALFLPKWGGADSFRSPISSLECPEIELEPAFPENGAMALRDKKGEVLSSASVATQLLDFYKKSITDSEALENPSSALVLALEAQEAIRSIEGAIHAARQTGTCVETPQVQKALARELMEKPEQFITEVHGFTSRNPSEFNLAKIFQGRSTNSGRISEANCTSCEPKSNLESTAMAQILDSPLLGDRKKEVLKILENTALLCKGTHRTLFKGVPQPTRRFLHHPLELYSVVQNRFGSGSPSKKQPFALSICRPILEKGRNYSGIVRNINGGQKELCASPQESLPVTVYGSRRDSHTGHCELKVKSPSGQACEEYSKEWPCKNGNLWIDIEALGRNSHEAVYLNP